MFIVHRASDPIPRISINLSGEAKDSLGKHNSEASDFKFTDFLSGKASKK